MVDPLDVLKIVAHNQRDDDDLLKKLAQVSQATQAQVSQATQAQVSQATQASAFEVIARTMTEGPLRIHWMEDVDYIGEFVTCASKSDPIREYHRDLNNKIDEQHFGEGNVTARSLLLGRFMGLDDLLYGPDSYSSCLGLTLSDLFELSGKQLLDIGCGDSLFPAEAKSLFNITVKGIDLHAVVARDAKEKIFKQYVKNLLFSRYLRKVRNFEVRGTQGTEPLQDMLHWGLQKTYENYLNFKPEKGDAVALPYKDNQFDSAVSNWLFMYLTEEQATLALREMVRVTKPGGTIRICEGQWFELLGHFGIGKGLSSKGILQVKGIKEKACPKQYRNPGGLRIFEVTKWW